MASTDPRPLPEFVDHTDNRRRNDTDPSSPSSPNESKENVNFIKRDAGFVYRQTWKGKIWDTFDLPPFERKMLFKVDAVLLTLLSTGYFLKNLDQHNITAAFHSGMRDDMEMFGNELVTAVTIWNVGYVLGQIPINLVLTRVAPRWVIPTLILIWGIATLGTYSIKNMTHLYVCRFLVGLFESGFYSASHYILGSWYTPRELGKRAVIFWASGLIGNMFAGYLQSAAYTNLSGVGGLQGWRWLFIINAIITIPIALTGYLFYPDSPLNGKSPWWLNKDEFELACHRANNFGRVGRTPWTWAKVKRLSSSWHFYLLPLLYILWNNGVMQPPMQYWMTSFNRAPFPGGDQRWTIPQVNNLPTVTTAVLFVFALTGAWISDGPLKGRRYPIILFDATMSIVFGIAHLAAPLYPDNPWGRIVMFWLMSLGSISGPLILTWANEVCADDLEKRALIVAMGNDFAYVLQCIAPNFVWQTVDFPRAFKGSIYSICLNVALIFTTIAVYLLRKRDLARDAAARDAIRTPGTEQYNGSLGDTKDANEVVESEERTPVTAVLNDEGKHRL